MTIEEAIKHLKLCVRSRMFIPNNEILDMAIEALEKQIPKKPIRIDDWGEYYKCPICDEYAVDHLGCKYKFCRECGQRLDWK